ncbi:ShlB/FhaC/HecB family hemolysin secretion/activation protein [Lyngbya aestuarii]|uniref:ShlB/FhaC/HecB family hemolysin secretion/activation protein n=1 Tax=Lyngbya aestuarii TaxID=118322 RepID=UPI00403E023A
MFRYSIVSIPGFALLTSFCPSYALATVSPTLSEAATIAEITTPVAQQPNPNQERFLPRNPETLPSQPRETQPIIPNPTEESEPASSEEEQPKVTIAVNQIEVTGSTVFDAEELAPITSPLEGRSVSLEELKGVSQAITQLYLDAGYITSRAVLVDQQITDGIVRIQVFEGSLQEIQIEGTQRLNPSYIRRRIQLGVATPLRVDQLEDQLRLLRIDPLLDNIEASLRSGEEIGQSILVVKVQEAEPFYGNVSVDNYSPPSIGSERLGVALGYRNLTGIGDNLAGSYYRSTTGGSNVFDVSYLAPINPKNGTLQLRAVIDRNQVTAEPFKEFDIEGESELYEISWRQPLIRTPREELALSLGFNFRDGQTFLFNDIATPFGIGPDEDGISRTSVFRFGQDYIKRDTRGAWSVRSQFNIGTGLFDATVNDHPIPDSRFFSWLGQIQRVQNLSKNQLLIMQADLQLTPDSLLPSEQFVIGGGLSLRGYRQNARSGDNGFRFSLEDRITLKRDEAGFSIFQLAPFADLGAIWNHPDNPNDLPDQTFLAGIGLGLLWEPSPGLNIRIDYAVPLVDLDDRGENAQDEGFYFSVGYGF